MSDNIYIPIGISCFSTLYLRTTGRRKESYPFDWNVTPIVSALQLIENNFKGFMELDSLEFLSPARRLLVQEDGVDCKTSEDIVTPVVCRRYGILFPHDFSESGIEDYKNVKARYEIRIRRLLNEMTQPSKKVFVYNLGQLNDWQLEQYTGAQCTFKENSREEVEACFSDLSFNNTQLTSLGELQGRKHPINKVESL